MSRTAPIRAAAFAWLLALALPAAAVPPADFDAAAAKTAAKADEASLDAPAKAALEQSQRALLDKSTAACATPNPDFSAFVVVMELGADGRVARTWREGVSPLSICVERAVRGQMLMVPPRTPFYSLIEISFSK